MSRPKYLGMERKCKYCGEQMPTTGRGTKRGICSKACKRAWDDKERNVKRSIRLTKEWMDASR